MRIRARLMLLVTLLPLVAAPVLAQDDQTALPEPSLTPDAIQFTHRTLVDGLSQSSVFDVLQDRRGFLWFGTQDGLNRYDGREFKVFKHVPFDSTSLSDNWIFSMEEAADGNFWLGTNGGGLNRFDPVSGKATRFGHVTGDTTSLSSNLVFSVEVDSEGIVWAGTDGGLNSVNPVTGSIRRYETPKTDNVRLPGGLVFSVHEDASGRLWTGTAAGLSRLDRESGTFVHHSLSDAPLTFEDRVPAGSVTDIHSDPRDATTLWLTGGFGMARFDTRSGDVQTFAVPGEIEDLLRVVADPNLPHVLWATSDGGGLFRFDSKLEEYTVFRHDPTDPASLGSDELFAIEADRTGMVWVGGQARSGVDMFDPSAGGFVNYRHRPGDMNSLSPASVWRVYMPPSRPYEVWTAHQADAQRTHDELNRIDRRTGRVDRFTHDPMDSRSLGRGQVPSLHEDRLGQLWIATIGGGLNLFVPDSRSFRRFTAGQDGSAISSNFVTSIREGTDGALWIGTFGGGVNRMDPARPGIVKQYQEVVGDSTSLLGKNIQTDAIEIAADGTVWVGTDAGLNRIDPLSDVVQRFPSNAPDGLVGTNVVAINVDRTGAVWVVAADHGHHVLNRLDPMANSWTTYRYGAEPSASLADVQITAGIERPQEPGIVWIGTTAGGITRIDPSADALEHFTESDGLPNNFVYGILVDDAGNLWLSTNNGLSRFNPESRTFRNFDEADGLISREFNSNAFFRSAAGDMAFGGVAGVTVFDPADIQPNPIPPTVVLTDFQLFNHSVVPGEGSVLSTPIGETKSVRLAHWQKTVTIGYVGLHFRNAGKNTYAYMLEGFDDDWVQAGTRRSATYTNLDPGQYVFRVRSANSDGIWNDEGVALALAIAPPFWETIWFRALAVLAMLGLGATVYRTRMRHMHERTEELEREVGARTVELRSKNQQLEQSHAIVAAINAETLFGSLLHAVLEQTKVIPGVEKASALVYDPTEDAYLFRASVGWDVSQLAMVRMSQADAEARYTDHAEEVAADIFLERNIAEKPGHAILTEIGTPCSMLVMRVRAQGRVEGYLIFDNMSDRDAFDQQDLDLLVMLREHVRSAFVKTRLLEDLRRSLEHLKATQNQLIQAEKMASLGQLTAGIAHEIKNPLNFVNNFAGLCADLADELEEELAARGLSDPDVLEIIGDLRLNSTKIQEHGKRADGIVRSMLQHSRGTSGEMRATDVNSLLDEYVNLAYHGMRARQADFNVTIDRAFDPDVGAVSVIPQEMGRVFINLLDNAFYAVNKRALAENGGYEPRVAVRTARRNGAVEIRVADNGPGIPDVVRKRIFEPFYTTKPTGEGTGLGLSMSYDIVTQVHGGTVSVESEDGRGTTFTIVIPAT